MKNENIDRKRPKGELRLLSRIAEQTDGIVEKMDECFLKDQSEDFYLGLLAGYDVPAGIISRYYAEDDRISELNNLTSYIAYIIVEKQFNTKEVSKNGEIIYDRPIDDERIEDLISESTNISHERYKSLDKTFKGRQKSDFYRGFLTGLDNTLKIDTRIKPPINELLMYVANKTIEKII